MTLIVIFIVVHMLHY